MNVDDEWVGRMHCGDRVVHSFLLYCPTFILILHRILSYFISNRQVDEEEIQAPKGTPKCSNGTNYLLFTT